MPRKTKAERKARRQQIVDNVKTFIDKHDDKVLPLVKLVLQKKFPAAAVILDAIKEARESKLPTETKSLVVDQLTELLATTDDDPADDEPARLLNSTLVSKFVSPMNLIFSAIAFYGALATEIAHTWGLIAVAPDKQILMMTAAIYAPLHGLNIWSRTEQKKTLLTQE